MGATVLSYYLSSLRLQTTQEQGQYLAHLGARGVLEHHGLFNVGTQNDLSNDHYYSIHYELS